MAEPNITDWSVVESAVASAVRDYARAYFIPANFLCGGDPKLMDIMAGNWGEISAPFIVARIREELRKAAVAESSGGGDQT